jgi:L-arabonate dehydrase
VKLTIDDFDRLGSDAALPGQPAALSGQYLMEDFCYAGGLPW